MVNFLILGLDKGSVVSLIENSASDNGLIEIKIANSVINYYKGKIQFINDKKLMNLGNAVYYRWVNDED